MVAKVALPFAAWEPDKAIISGTAAEAKGVVSVAGRYAPLKSLQALKPGSAMNDTALGGAGFYDTAGGVRIFLGDSGALYEIQSRVPVNVSRIGGYGVSPDWAWVFEQLGTSVYATARGLNQMQRFEFGVSTKFADVATGPGLSDTLFRVREFLFSGYQKTVKNSAFNNPLDWVPDSGTQAGQFDLPHDGGDIVIGTGGQFGLIFQERKVHRLIYQGGSAPFQRDEIEDKRGALGPNAICRHGMTTFFASDDGIRVTDGSGESTGIGDGKVDRYFASNLNYAARSRVSMACDVEKKVLKIAFPASGNSYCNKLLIYSIADGRWSYDDIATDLLFEAPRHGVTVDDSAAIIAIVGADVVDSITATVDSAIWAETRKQIMAVDPTHTVCTFEGQNRPATLETGYGEVAPGRMGYVSEVWPLTDAQTCTAAITTKMKRLSDTPVNGTAVAMNADGFCPLRHEARWFRARVEIPTGVTWSEAVGVDWDARVSGGI